MTSKEDVERYEQIANNSEVVESSLQTMFTEVICAEITQTVIEDISEAIDWLKCTYFYVRVRKNPERYGFSEVESMEQLDNQLKELCLQNIHDLADARIILLGEDGQVSPLSEANIMSSRVIKFRTMVMLMQIPPLTGIQELLLELSQAEETQKPVKRNEKTLLNNIMKGLRFPVKAKTQGEQLTL